MRKHYPLNSNGAEDAAKLPWTDGVPSTGVEGSYPGQALFTDTEAEILAAIDGGGFVRSGADLTQLLQTISRGLWLGVFGGTATALTATLPNNLVIPTLQAGMRLRGIAASDFTGTGGTLKITGIGTAAGVMSCPLVGSDGTTALASGAWKAGQFLTFDIDAAGNARFGGGAGSSNLATLVPSGGFVPLPGYTLPADTPNYDWTWPDGYDFVRMTTNFPGPVANVEVQVSVDGSTFRSGASDYSGGSFTTGTNGTAGTTYPNGNGQWMGLTILMDLSTGIAFAQGTMFRGSSSRNAMISVFTTGYQNTPGYQEGLSQASANFLGAAQKLRFIAATGTMKAGSRFAFEGLKAS